MTVLSLARVRSLVDLGRYVEARAELVRFLAGEPDSVLGLCLLAACELELENYPGALDAAGRALAFDPESDWALRLCALALSKQDQHAYAVENAEAAVRVAPDFWANHYTLGQVLLARQDKQRAHEVAKRAVELAPHEADTHVLLGLTAAGLGLEVTERRAYEQALALDPDNAMALNNLAAADINYGTLGSAARKVVAGLRLSPGDETLRRNLDAVALRLMQRLFNVMLLSAVLLLWVGMVVSGNEWWPRATVGAVLLCCYAVVALATLRHLPRGARRHLRGLPRRMTTGQRLLAIGLVVFTVALLIAAFAPGDGWKAGAGVIVVIVRIVQILLVVWVIRWIIGKIARHRT